MHVYHPAEEPTIPVRLRMTPAVYEQIKETIGMQKAETGGILGGKRSTGEVTHFYFDETPHEQTSGTYTPNTAVLNKVLETEWKPQGIEYLGSVHSHPPFYKCPSPGDEVFARRILDALDLPYLLTPIVTTVADTGSFSLFPFAAMRDGDGVKIVEQELAVGPTGARSAQRLWTDDCDDCDEISWQELWTMLVTFWLMFKEFSTFNPYGTSTGLIDWVSFALCASTVLAANLATLARLYKESHLAEQRRENKG